MKTKLFFNAAAITVASIFCFQKANAQSWLLSGNSDATNASKLGTLNNVPLRIYASGSERIHITNTGNVGIGVLSPLQKLQVAGASIIANNTIINPSAAANSVIAGAVHDGSGWAVTSGIGGKATVGNAWGIGSINGNLYFGFSNGSADNTMQTAIQVVGSSRNVLLAPGILGNVGIGTNTPQRKLQVQDGDIRISQASSNARYFEFVSTVSNENDVRMEHSFGGSSLYFSSSNNDFGSFTDLARFDLASSPTYVFTIFGSGLASGGVWQNSDLKLKRNINEVDNAISIINQLKPKTYLFKTDEYSKLNLPASKQYGFIAQDVEKVLPELVNTSQQPVSVSAKGERKMEEIKSMNYTELIPILTKALQEQQQQIEELKQTVQSLSDKMGISNAAAQSNSIKLNNTFSLGQNIPNPFSNSSSISYYVPSSFHTAQLIITDENGKVLKTYAITQSGSGSQTILGNNLISGMYQYSLMIDGKVMDTKKMMLAK